MDFLIKITKFQIEFNKFKQLQLKTFYKILKIKN